MKRCAKCGKENADDMRFCLECGNQLADAPFVVNLQGDTSPKQADLKTDNFGQSVNTQVNTPYSPPDYSTNRPRKSNTKLFLAVGGVVALLLLLMTAVGAIVVYNLMSDEKVDPKPTPTPAIVSNRPAEKDSPTPKSSATPKTSPTEDSTNPPPVENDPDITVKFDKVEVDYNVTEKGKSGMRMSVNFTVSGMKGKDGYLAIHIQNRDSDPLPAAKVGEYRDVNGNLSVFQKIKPEYDETDYKDLELFLPYDEFDLSAGRHELRMDIDLLNIKGETIEHLTYENFWYEQK